MFQRKHNLTFLLFIAPLSIVPVKVQATSITAVESKSNGKLEAYLGSAYQSDKQRFVGDSCLTRPAVPSTAGVAQAGFTFDESISEAQLSSELGLDVGGRARFGAVQFEASANFLRNSMSNSLSLSAVWESNYTFPTEKLSEPVLNEIGKSVRNNDERWATTCGDEYVAEITKGAKLFFSIRVDFANQAEKEAFEARFSVSGPLFDVNSQLKTASTSFSRHTKVTISGYQLGGDVSKLTQLFDPSENGRKTFITCELGGYEQCAQVVSSALSYAIDVEKGFPSQLAPDQKPGPASLTYRTVSYSAIGIYPIGYPHLDQATVLARQRLSDAFEPQFKNSVRADRLLHQHLFGTRKLAVEAEKAKIDGNISQLLSASKVCYDTPQDCWREMADGVKLQIIDESVFEAESFARLCTEARALSSLDPLRITFEAIEEALNTHGNLSCTDLEQMILNQSSLTLVSNATRPIRDLRPLSTMTSLTSLTVKGGRVDDLTPLADLVNLRMLDLSHNRIKDLSPLMDMLDLINLNLSFNRITNLSPLSRMFQLQWLLISNNLVSDLSPLIYFPQMLSVDLRMNPASDEEIGKLRSRLPSGTTISR